MAMWLIDNEGKELSDDYGRKWKFSNKKFYFKGIGDSDSYREGVGDLHLFATNITVLDCNKEQTK